MGFGSAHKCLSFYAEKDHGGPREAKGSGVWSHRPIHIVGSDTILPRPCLEEEKYLLLFDMIHLNKRLASVKVF